MRFIKFPIRNMKNATSKIQIDRLHAISVKVNIEKEIMKVDKKYIPIFHTNQEMSASNTQKSIYYAHGIPHYARIMNVDKSLGWIMIKTHSSNIQSVKTELDNYNTAIDVCDKNKDLPLNKMKKESYFFYQLSIQIS